MASNESEFVQKLIAQSKNLAEANVKKCQNERIFKELTLFQNLSNFCKLDKNNGDSCNNFTGLEKVFKVSVSVYPSPLRLDPVRANETMTLVLENVSKTFSFSSNYWQFLVDFNNGEEVSSWSLENNLDPGSSESFSISFHTTRDISPIQVRLRLLFSITHLEQTFVKSLLLYQTCLDILHLLTPSRYPRAAMPGSLSALDPAAPFYTVSNPAANGTQNKSGDKHGRSGGHHRRGRGQTQKSPEDGDEEDEELPSITQFFFKLCPNLMKSFVSHVLLQHCRGRWSSMKSGEVISALKRSSTFSMFYLEDEIVVSTKSNGMIAFKSTNPRVLCALKVGILTRLMLIKNIKVSAPDDSICEKLYALRLRLEDISTPGWQASSAQIRDFVDIYLDLRDISEMIEFSSDTVMKSEDTDSDVVVID